MRPTLFALAGLLAPILESNKPLLRRLISRATRKQDTGRIEVGGNPEKKQLVKACYKTHTIVIGIVILLIA